MRKLKLPTLIAVLCFSFALFSFFLAYATSLARAESNTEYIAAKQGLEKDDLWPVMLEAETRFSARQSIGAALPNLILGGLTVAHIFQLRRDLKTPKRVGESSEE